MPTEIHFVGTERRQVPVQYRGDVALGIEDEVAHPDVSPEEDGGPLRRHMTGRTESRACANAGSGSPSEGDFHVCHPSASPFPAEVYARATSAPRHISLPVDGMHVRHRVHEPVQHHALQCGAGVSHVGVEERGAGPGMSPCHARHDQERRADPLGIAHDERRRRSRHTPPRRPRSGRAPADPGRSPGTWPPAAAAAPPSPDGPDQGRRGGSRWPGRLGTQTPTRTPRPTGRGPATARTTSGLAVTQRASPASTTASSRVAPVATYGR